MTRTLPHWVGNEYTIHAGDYSAVITEQGAGLERLDWNGKELIVPFDPDDPVSACRGQLLIPYPNRIEDGEYEFEGNKYLFPIDEHERNNSIHGLGYRYPWKLVSLTDSSITLSWRTPNLASYPFDLYVETTYTVDAEAGLSVTVSACNNDKKNAPWALAQHPWLANGEHHTTTEEIEADNAACRLTIPAKTHVIASERLLPAGLEDVEGTRFDLRHGNELGMQEFDDAWTDVEYNAQGTVTATFLRPDGVEISLSGDKTITSFQVCNGYGWDAEKKPQGVAVEPQTAYANAFRSGKDLIVIKPGETSSTTLTYSARMAH
ncbi:aldose 1-epimerase family protein [Alloscardovia venturai]|uniref:Aldose 1-epimerase family protein n=1 Tax=Alloscardovia venturai TaxID=1769421 RepID=A0ABW2Y5V9_9BIFI